VPLEAAREQLGLVESRIRQIEDTLKNAVVVQPSGEKAKTVRVGTKVHLKDLESGRETRYTVVSASEARPLDGKISDVSPVGKALMKRSAGQEIRVETPRGQLKYRIVKLTS
jgi:transcription elongation factor GreA